MTTTHTCQCGFTWQHGMSGSHMCEPHYREQIAELKRERDALAAENTGLNNFIATSCYVWAGEDPAWHPAIDHSPETPATNQLSIEESRFLTDVITAAGLLSCGKQDKGLARRITDFCVAKIGSSNPAQLRKEVGNGQ